jgi:hypothetical protein
MIIPSRRLIDPRQAATALISTATSLRIVAVEFFEPSI